MAREEEEASAETAKADRLQRSLKVELQEAEEVAQLRAAATQDAQLAEAAADALKAELKLAQEHSEQLGAELEDRTELHVKSQQKQAAAEQQKAQKAEEEIQRLVGELAQLRTEPSGEAVQKPAVPELDAHPTSSPTLRSNGILEAPTRVTLASDSEILGLTFEGGSRPPRVRKVLGARQAFWASRQVVKGSVLVGVNGQPVHESSAQDVLPLLSARPLDLEFRNLSDLSSQSTATRHPDAGHRESTSPSRRFSGLPGPTSDSALHEAARDGQLVECLRILAQPDFQGVNAKDSLGKTALHWAVVSDMTEVCFALLQRDDFTSVEAKDWRGMTAYDVALKHNAPKELLDELQPKPSAA